MTQLMTLEIISGNQKKDPSKTWEGVRLQIGDFRHVFFAKSPFEMQYIKSQIELAQGKVEVK